MNIKLKSILSAAALGFGLIAAARAACFGARMGLTNPRTRV